MDSTLSQENLSRATPDHDQAITSILPFEFTNIGAKLLGQIHFVAALLDVFAVELLDVISIKYRSAWFDRFEIRFDFFQELFLQDARVRRCFKCIFFKDVPAGEYEIIELSQRNKVFDLWRPALRAFAQADGSHLSQ